MLDNIQTLREQAIQEINNSNDLAALDERRVHYLGKKGAMTELAKSISQSLTLLQS